MNRSFRSCSIALLLLSAYPAAALEQPVIWRDEDTGCAYLRRDGTLDCPEVAASTGVVENMGRDLARGLDALQREVERLRERYNRP